MLPQRLSASLLNPRVSIAIQYQIRQKHYPLAWHVHYFGHTSHAVCETPASTPTRQTARSKSTGFGAARFRVQGLPRGEQLVPAEQCVSA